MKNYHTCNISKSMNNTQSLTFKCLENSVHPDLYYESCNQDPKFCALKFNQVMFPGAHKAGLEADKYEDCQLTTHDLSLSEMLDFGIRFFDFLVKYSVQKMLYAGLGSDKASMKKEWHKYVYNFFSSLDHTFPVHLLS